MLQMGLFVSKISWGYLPAKCFQFFFITMRFHAWSLYNFCDGWKKTVLKLVLPCLWWHEIVDCLIVLLLQLEWVRPVGGLCGQTESVCWPGWPQWRRAGLLPPQSTAAPAQSTGPSSDINWATITSHCPGKIDFHRHGEEQYVQIAALIRLTHGILPSYWVVAWLINAGNGLYQWEQNMSYNSGDFDWLNDVRLIEYNYDTHAM